MLHFIGLGLGDHKSITVNGLETIQRCDHLFLENYTSKLTVPTERLETYYDKDITEVTRDDVEKNADKILKPAKNNIVAFLVIGDPFGATTHTDLFLRATAQNIETNIIHNTSILNAVGQTGLQLYKFGKTTSIVKKQDWTPKTPYKALKSNLEKNLHTLFLLDIQTHKEPSEYMTVREGLETLQLLEHQEGENLITEQTKAIGLARLGTDNIIKYGTIQQLKNYDFGKPLHSIILPAKLHEKEQEMLQLYEVKP